MRKKYIAVLIVVAVALITLMLGQKNVLAQTNVKGKYYDYIYAVTVQGDQLSINVPGNLDPNVHGNCPNPWWARADGLAKEQTKAWLNLSIASFLGRRRVYIVTQGCRPDGMGYVLYAIQLEDKL